MALLPLLQGRIEIPDLWIEGPDVLLERDASGRGNWLAAPPLVQAGATPSVPRARMPVVVGRGAGGAAAGGGGGATWS